MAFGEDIQAKGFTGYQTFREGWIYQKIIDYIRDGVGWLAVEGLEQ